MKTETEMKTRLLKYKEIEADQMKGNNYNKTRSFKVEACEELIIFKEY